MKEYPLRERKYAATKAALLDAVLARLHDQTLDSISVKEVCREVPVSEATFFNYFTSKDVVRHPLVAAIIEAYEADSGTS